MKFFPIENATCVPYPIGDEMKTVDNIVRQMATQFRKIYTPNDSIKLLFRGSSGAIMATLLNTKLREYRICLVPVRKPGENSHIGKGYIYNEDDRHKIVIIDDFMSSGATVNAIAEEYHELSIDTLILSSVVDMNLLSFTPENVISHKVILHDDDDGTPVHKRIEQLNDAQVQAQYEGQPAK